MRCVNNSVPATLPVPGADVSLYGYVVFATDCCGDTYCYNINNINNDGNPEIVFIPHSVDFEGKLKAFVDEHAEKVSDNLLNFLQKKFKGRD